MSNRSADLTGLLSLLYKGPRFSMCWNIDEYDLAKQEILGCKFENSHTTLAKNYHMLNPKDFGALANAVEDEQLSARHASICFAQFWH